ncbi:chromosomal replication initiator protein DnaA [Rickettsiales bacterium]|nr:chromosomal replication initiator protein DnaA [Rickettsiales bacterium]MDB2550873.1 chromosomal replication initiator protein DnaA [Rickettsiales bacterium]
MIEGNKITSDKKDLFWKKAKLQFQNYFDYEIYDRWISKIDIFSFSKDEIVLSVSSKFLRDWIMREYFEVIKDAIISVDSNIRLFSLIFIEDNKKIDIKINKKSKIVNLTKYDNVFTFGTDLNEKFTFDNLIIGDFNKLAVGAAKIISSNNASSFSLSDINPLFLHGSVGLGKTHIGQSVAWKIKEENKNQNVIYLSAERFVHHFVKSIRDKTIMDFKEKFKNIDVLIIDDIQFIAKKTGTQEEMLHVINNLVENKKRVILICDQSPGDIDDIGEKFRSRIAGGMVVDLKLPNYCDRLEILRKKITDLAIEVDDEVLELIASKVSSNIRDLEGAIKKLAANYIIANEEINLQNTKNILLDFFRNSQSNIGSELIQKQVAKFFKIKITDLKSTSRNIKIARSRQIAMFLLKNMTDMSLAQIGREFNKNHATVIYACNKIEELIYKDSNIKSNIKEIENIINNI